ncbi:MAG TPA: hypothetical protein VK585_16845 [Jiangellaceae bacterium]|nr:hypothetical protein [Jiangellaceae bacterium]
MLRLRIELPDQPGSLGRVTWTLGVLGADVAQIYVLERDGGRALDDITLEWRGQPRDRLLSALRSIPGVRPVGVWATRATAEAMPEAGVMAAMVTAPSRALATLMDAAPLVLAATWACVSDSAGQVRMASPQAPAHPRLPEAAPVRIVAITDGARLARAPLPGEHVLTVAREDGPSFHRSELGRLQHILDVLACLPLSTVLDPVTTP